MMPMTIKMTVSVTNRIRARFNHVGIEFISLEAVNNSITNLDDVSLFIVNIASEHALLFRI